MFWRRNGKGLALAAFAMALVAGEVVGFGAARLSGLWPWMLFLAALAFGVTIGWNVPFGHYLAVGVLGVALAWRVEANRLSLEDRFCRSEGTAGEFGSRPCRPPAYDVTVESEARCVRRRQGDGLSVSFLSHLGAVPVKVVAPVREGGVIPAAGEIWRCAGWLALRKSAPSRYAQRTLWVMDETHMVRLAARPAGPAAVYRKLAARLSRRMGTGLGWNPELAALNRAMLLGCRSGIPPEKRAQFASAGTMHVFAISGLHVMLISALLNMLLQKAGLSPQARAACVIPLLAGYVMLSGARPSAVRAAAMASLWLGAGLFGRRPDALAAWSLTALAVYGLSPAMVFDVGCALSFAVMLGIVLWLRWSAPFASPLDGLLRAAATEQALGGRRRMRALLLLHGRCAALLSAFGISAAAWIMGTPIAARAFGQLTLGGLAANIVVVPLAGVAVMLCAAGAAVSFVLPPLGACLNNLAAFCTWTMTWISARVASCPGASFETLRWSWLDCGIWYLAWAALAAVIARHLPPRERISVKTWE